CGSRRRVRSRGAAVTAPVTTGDLRARARRVFDRDSRAWAAQGDDSAVLEAPLHPFTERGALADLDGSRAWVESWRRASRSGDIEVVWARRDWARVGSQEVPERAIVRGPAAIARVGGLSAEWALLAERLGILRVLPGDAGALEAALRTHARTITGLDGPDFERLVGVVEWLRENPASGRHVRELPIRGIHTKWIEARRGLVEALHRATTGSAALGLWEPDPLVRVRFLDPALAPRGLADVSAPVSELAKLHVEPERIFVFENLATVLAMPPVADGVVIDGGGQRVELVARLPWVRSVGSLTYWGDLDSHGFAILHRLRSHGVAAMSALMDTETLLAHRDLWGADDAPNIGVLPRLTADEQSTLRLLGSEGNVRLEQERIPWEYALTRLGVAR
ncbi:Wadjet anti-phage system protein JetD domain-containing protein, partial [Microbacterium sp.]|uniref:Wadjet anti-phage system protein JetD domain-containing protein n=1 Tax=Microbacterium sp. TaxID=51671 RepID=UPI003C747CC9